MNIDIKKIEKYIKDEGELWAMLYNNESDEPFIVYNEEYGISEEVMADDIEIRISRVRIENEMNVTINEGTMDSTIEGSGSADYYVTGKVLEGDWESHGYDDFAEKDKSYDFTYRINVDNTSDCFKDCYIFDI